LKIWFDTIAPKQYLFSEYFIQKLKHKHKIFVTSRKYPQVNDIMRFGVTTPILVGKHGGKNKIDNLVSIDSHSLESHVVTARILYEYEKTIFM